MKRKYETITKSDIIVDEGHYKCDDCDDGFLVSGTYFLIEECGHIFCNECFYIKASESIFHDEKCECLDNCYIKDIDIEEFKKLEQNK